MTTHGSPLDPIELEIPARTRSLGEFDVGRVLPAPARRTVGPFIFFDHMGPAHLAAGRGMDVRPHPHVCLATVTYLFEGEIFHRDSLGSALAIRPGAINWMTAGRGIVHSERSPAEARPAGPVLHGLQLWVALPKSQEEREPAFAHHPADTIPELTERGVVLRVLAGEAHGARSPVEVASPLFYVEARLDAGARLELTDHEERAVYVVEGAVECDGAPLRPRTMAVLRPGVRPVLTATAPTRLVTLGGAPLDGPRYVWWNFVASSKERIIEAARQWKADGFPRVPGDEHERIPLTDEPHFPAP